MGDPRRPAPQPLPLFPLGTVLMPGAALPLRIFEPRYVALLHRLRTSDGDPRQVGIIAIRRGHEVGPENARELHEIGCAATLGQVTPLSREGLGHYAVEFTGARRFRLLGLDPAAGTPYLTGLVTWVEDLPGGAPDRLAEATRSAAAAVAAYRRAVGAPAIRLPEEPTACSYAAAAALSLPLTEQQSLLAARTTLDRLRQVTEVAHREAGLVAELRLAPARPVAPPDASHLN